MQRRPQFEIWFLSFGSLFFLPGALIMSVGLTWKLWHQSEPISVWGWAFVLTIVLFPFLHFFGLRGRFIAGLAASLFHAAACIFIGWLAVRITPEQFGKSIVFWCWFTFHLTFAT